MRAHHRLVAALVGLALHAAAGRPARAQVAMVTTPPPAPATGGGGGAEVSIAVVAGAFLATSVGFGIYDGVRAGEGVLPSRGVAIAQAAVASPQVLAFGILHGVGSAGHESEKAPVTALVLAPGLANALFMHGVWASQTPVVPAGVPLGVSAAVGFDTALTVSILARAGGGHLSSPGMGVMQMVLTTPQVAVSAYEVATDPRHRGGWAGLTAWSGAIFTHGLVSAIVGWLPPSQEPPPVPPPPPPVPEKPPLRVPVPEKPPLMVPASLYLEPRPMAGGAGVVLGGRWL